METTIFLRKTNKSPFSVTRVHDGWMRLNFESWLAWEQTGRKGCTIAAAASQLGTSREVVLKLLKAGRLDEVRIYEAGKHAATLVTF